MRTITQEYMHKYGYMWDGMIPLTPEEARKVALVADVEIYRLYSDDTESRVNNEEIEDGYLYGIEKANCKK